MKLYWMEVKRQQRYNMSLSSCMKGFVYFFKKLKNKKHIEINNSDPDLLIKQSVYLRFYMYIFLFGFS